MPKKRTEKTDLNRLCQAMQSSRLTLRWNRQQRKEAVRQYAGSRWSEEATKEKIHVNFLALYVRTVIRNLIANNPRVMLSVFDKKDKPAVSAMETWANKEIADMHLANTLQRIILDSLFQIGIAKVALATPAESSIGAWNTPAGQPMVQRVDLDDFVYDIHARDFSEAAFIGHRFRVPLAVIMDDKTNYNRQRKDLTASSDPRFNQEGDERINVLGRGYYGNDEEIEDMVDLWEVYVPRHKCIYTLSEDCLTGVMAPSHGGEPEALREQQWIGPDDGPYHILGFETVPGNAMPKGPIQDLIELHLPLNEIMRKLLRQSARHKDLTIVQRGLDGDMERYRDANDGDIVGADNPAAAKAISMGGPNQLLFQFFLQLKELFSWMAGNLDIMGGLSPQAKTASQDQMLNTNSSRSITDMQDRTVSFTSKIIQSLCWYWWHDPSKVMKTKFALAGLPEVSISRRVYPPGQPDPKALQRTALWDELDVKVDPYSLAHQTPQQRAQSLTQLVTQLYIPMASIMQEQGIALDMNTFLTKLGTYLDMPDLPDILQIQEPPQQDSQSGLPTGGAEAGPKPAKTERTYVRENMPGRTRQGNDMNQLNQLAGVNAGGSPDSSQG